ncbi:CHASE2 domain-containing protein [Candidatus Riflebacteria bacterium]
MNRVPWIFLPCLIVFLGLFWAESSGYISFDQRFQDFFFALKYAETDGEVRDLDPDLLIVRLDNETFKKLGPDFSTYFPYLVELIQNLQAMHARAIVFDLGLSVLRSRKDSTTLLQTVKGQKNIFFVFDLDTSKEGVTREIPDKKVVTDFLSSIKLEQGYMNLYPDKDGRIRYYKLFRAWKGKKYPSLAFKVFLNLKNLKLEDGIKQLQSRGIPTRLPINWRGGDGRFLSYSFADLVNQASKTEEEIESLANVLRNKIVLIAPTATMFHDQHLTALGSVQGGTIHAAVISQLLRVDHGMGRHSPALTIAFLLFFIIFIFFISYFSLKWVHLFVFFLGFAGISGSYWIFIETQSFFQYQGFFLFQFFLLWILGLFIRQVLETRQRRLYRELFANFVSPEVFESIMEDRSIMQNLEGKSYNLTILFSDIRNFTTFSEQATSTEVFDALNQLFAVMLPPIFVEKGRLDKFIGDAIMAVWGAPCPVDNPSLHAIRAALKMQLAVEEFNKTREKEGKPGFQIGIGLHSGEANVGILGSRGKLAGKLEYAVIGDAVNLASRIESMCKSAGVSLLFSKAVKEAIEEEFACRSLGEFAIKGKREDVELFTLSSINVQEG